MDTTKNHLFRTINGLFAAFFILLIYMHPMKFNCFLFSFYIIKEFLTSAHGVSSSVFFNARFSFRLCQIK